MTAKAINNVTKLNIISIFTIISILKVINSTTLEKVYNSILVQNFNLIFVFTNENIYSYDSTTLNEKYKIELEYQIANSLDAETISVDSTTNNNSNDDLNKIYISVKSYLYIFDKNGSLCKSLSVMIINSEPRNIIFQECSDDVNPPVCFCFLTYINSDKKLAIIKVKHIIQDNSFSIVKQIAYDLKNSLGETCENLIDYISCQIMTDSGQNFLICFYQNNNKEIASAIFEPLDLNEIHKTPQFKMIESAIFIKSVLYSDGSKAFVCYITNNGDCSCLSFDFSKNEWSDSEYKFLENCYQQSNLFSFDFYQNKNEYILACFNSETNLISVSFDSNMQLLDTNDNNYCISSQAITSCGEESFSFVINYDNGFEIDISCSNSNFLGALIQRDLPRLCSNGLSSSAPDTTITITINNEIQPSIVSITSPKGEAQNKTDSIISYKDYNSEYSLISDFYEVNSNVITKRTINKSKEDLVKNLDELMKDVELGKVYEMKADDYEVKISPINFNDYEGSSTYINFKECENTLREKNNLPKDSILTVIQIEIYKYEEKALTNQVEYAVYNDKRIKLDLSACEKDKIEINYAITNSSILDLDKLSEFSNMNVDILNIKDHFFTDICYPFSENNSDMILKDRRTNIYQNYSLCDNNCEYDRINISSMIIRCNCEVKKDIDTKKPPLKFEKIYVDLFSESTFGVSKCFNLVFDFKNKSKNIGFIIFTILVSLHIPILIYYFIVGIEPITKFVFNEMEKYNYIPKFKHPIKKSKKSFNKLFNSKKDILN